MNIYEHDDSFRKEGIRLIAGIDEAGRGPLAGPVVASAVILPEKLRIIGLRDSKKVPEKQRRSLFWEVICEAVAVGVGIVDHAGIDRLNILAATKKAMAHAAEDLLKKPDLFIIDAVTVPGLRTAQIPLVRADSQSACVAAASIVAKYVRDTMMSSFHEQYPEYNFRKHKGYGTKEHLQILRSLGPSPIHRKTFCGVLNTKLPF